MGHFYSNLLICLEADLLSVGHPALDFIEFFSEVVGDPALPEGLFGPYFIDQCVPRENTVGHLPV